MKYKAAIFDMDGTILNTLEDLTASLNDSLGKNGFPPRSIREVRSFAGNGIGKLIERGVPEGTDIPGIQNVHADFTEHYAKHCADRTRPYEGIPGLLRALRKNGCKTAVISNKADYAVQALCEEYFHGLFDAAAGERAGIPRKPAPNAVLEVLQNLGCAPEEAVYIGDSEVDMETAERAGTACIIVDWGFRDRDFLIARGAKTIVSHAAEIAGLIFGDGHI